MNFSLPKLSAVALLSLAAGFGASMWLNAEPEEPGQPKKCVFQTVDTFDLEGNRMVVNVCDVCIEPNDCYFNPNTYVYLVDPTNGQSSAPDMTRLKIGNVHCVACPEGSFLYQIPNKAKPK